MGAFFDEAWDELQDNIHKAVVGANQDLERRLKGAAPVDDDEMRQGIKVRKEAGRNGPVIESRVFVVGTQKLQDGQGRLKDVPNQLVANATNKRTGWANGLCDRWASDVDRWLDS